MIHAHEDVDVFVGLDVGKSDHHAVALDRTGKVLFDRALPNDESRLREILAQLGAHGQVLVVVDQAATIGALPVAVARDAGVMVGYLPGLSMRRIADLHPGQAKTDARDAAIIAEAARSMPHTLRSIALDDEKVAELSMLCGFDDDLRAQITATSNRARGLLTQIHPALERIVGPRLDHPAVLDLIQTWPTPGALAVAGTRRISTRLRRSAPRLADKLAAQITAALDEQTVVVTGTNAAAVVLPKLAAQLVTLRAQRDEVAAKVEELVDDHPLHVVLMSMAASGDQDRRPGLDRDRRQGLHLRRPPGLLRRPGPRHPPVRDLDPRRAPVPVREQGPQTCPVPIRVRRSARPHLQDLLRPQTRRRKAPQPSPHRTRTPPMRRPVRHAPRRHPLRPTRPNRLTNDIGAPPSIPSI